MKVPLKLNSIDQEHLQELYDSAGVARDELPYTPAFDAARAGIPGPHVQERRPRAGLRRPAQVRRAAAATPRPSCRPAS